jgi:uncharacterized oligopeptide transporter (OPT) family protein
MAEKKELTLTSLTGGIIIAAILGLSYPFVVLKLGMGPDLSMVSAFLGAILLNVVAAKSRGQNKWQNNIIQTMAGSAGATAFMCVIMAAFSYLYSNWGKDVGFNPQWWQILLWLTCSGSIGVLFIARFRKFFLDHPRMIFAGGVASAVVIQTLDSSKDSTAAESRDAMLRTRSLGIFGIAGALIAVFRDGVGWLGEWTINKGFRVGIGFDALSFGTGMLLPVSVGISYILGALILWLGGDTVIHYASMDVSRLGQYRAAMLWFMWPATAFMITASITSLLINVSKKKGPVPIKTGGEDYNAAAEKDIPLSVTIWGTVILTMLLATVQYLNFDVSPIKTITAVAFQLVLILAGVWVLGETNSGPVSLMANGVQFLFGLIWRHDIKGNLIAAGMAGDGNSQAEQTIQTFKTGRILGSTPWAMTVAQLIGVLIGALSVAIMFPLLVHKYGIGGSGQLSAPTGLKLANVAVLINEGIGAFPRGALRASEIAIALGIIFEVLREIRLKGRAIFFWLPSAAALGFGLILPPSISIMMGLGAIFSYAWARYAKESFDRYRTTVAAGLVVGEAVIAGLVLPVLAALGWI